MNFPDLQRNVLNLNKEKEKWSSLSVKERLVGVRKLRSLLQKNKEEYARAISVEMGKPIRFSEQEIEKCIALCDYCMVNAEAALRNREVKTEGRSFVSYEALGTILIISPWNYPFWLSLRPALQALCAGNCVVVKPSSAVPRCSVLLQKLFKDSGLKSALVVQTAADNINSLIEKNLIDGVLVIGGSQTGSKVASKAASKLKPHVLELGGSDPFIVFEDANLEDAARNVIESRMLNSGQNCDSAKRLIISKKIAARFEHLLIEELSKIKIGEPLDRETFLGPMINDDACEDMQALVDDARKKGARLIYGGHRLNRKGSYFMPTLLSDTTPEMDIMQQEVFGPILPIVTFEREEEAIAIANSSVYGLGASIWTKDKGRIMRMMSAIKAGVVCFNKRVRSDIRMPFGGIKNSGYGRELGIEGFRAFTNIKSIVLN